MPHSRSILRALIAASAAAAAVAAVPAPAAAQPYAKPGKVKSDKGQAEKKAQAKRYVEQGLAAQDAKKYDEALALYGKAYELVPHPILLFNMAQAHRLVGRPELARDLYRQYLDAEPTGAKAKTAREFLIALEAQIAAAPKPPPEPTKPATAAEPAGAPATPAVDLTATTDPAKARSDERHAASRARTLRLAGLISGGAGVASLGVGVVFHLRARSISDELSEPGITFDPDRESAGKTAERLMYVGYSAGAALLVGGAALYYFGRKATPTERVALLPSLSADSVGLVVTGGLP